MITAMSRLGAIFALSEKRLGLRRGPTRAAEDVLTVREIAATLYAMIERGQLAHFRANNATRVPRWELDRLVREGAPNHAS